VEYGPSARSLSAQGVPCNRSVYGAGEKADVAAHARNVDIALALENDISVIRADVAGPIHGMVSYGSSGIVDPHGNAMIRLIGPGGAGKSTIGALLAECLDVPFVDLRPESEISASTSADTVTTHTRERMLRRTVRCFAEKPALMLLRCRPAS
jgi:predicted amidohydrolase